MKFNVTSRTGLCDLDTGSGCQDAYAADILTAISIISLIINTLHIVILNKLPSLKGKAYLAVLVVISVADISYSAVTVVVTNCHIRHTVALSNYPQLWNFVSSVLARVTSVLRYMAILLSSMERYITVCKPYTTVTLMSHIGKIFVIIGILLATMLSAADLRFIDQVCVDSIFGPLAIGSFGTIVLGAGVVLTSTVSSLVLNILVLLEIRRMKRRALGGEDYELIKAAHYIMAVTAVIVTLMAPTLIIMPMIQRVGDAKVRPPNALVWFYLFSNTAYGLFNTLLYGFMFKAYRQAAVTTLGFKCCIRMQLNAVHPNRIEGSRA